jgi:type VI secretion system protein ImpJ
MTSRFDRSVPPAIQWHEGMLLMPQHFQQLATRNEMLAAYSVAFATPYPWGVARLSIDRGRLLSGIFRVDALEAMLPDGTLVTHPSPGSGVLELDLSAHAEALRKGKLKIHLVMPAAIEGVWGTAAQRFRSIESAPIADANDVGSEVRVAVLSPNLSLLATNAPTKRWVALPLAELSRVDEKIELTPFVAPTTRIAADSPLGAECLEMAKTIREKAAYLAENAKAGANGPAATMESRLLVHAMVSQLPMLEALIYSGAAHPLPIYTALCALTGGFATLGAAGFPPVPDVYDHSDLRATFARPLAFLAQAVAQINPEFTALAFEPTGTGFRLKMREQLMRRRLTIGVRAREDATAAATAAWFMDAQIGSASRMDALMERRILGAPRRLATSADSMPGPVPRGMQLFQVDTLPEFVTADEYLEVMNTARRDDPAQPAEIVMFVRVARGGPDKGK